MASARVHLARAAIEASGERARVFSRRGSDIFNGNINSYREPLKGFPDSTLPPPLWVGAVPFPKTMAVGRETCRFLLGRLICRRAPFRKGAKLRCVIGGLEDSLGYRSRSMGPDAMAASIRQVARREGEHVDPPVRPLAGAHLHTRLARAAQSPVRRVVPRDICQKFCRSIFITERGARLVARLEKSLPAVDGYRSSPGRRSRVSADVGHRRMPGRASHGRLESTASERALNSIASRPSVRPSKEVRAQRGNGTRYVKRETEKGEWREREVH